MLVLTRRTGERIQIGEDVEITIVEVRGEQVRIGIKAPRGITVHRKEIWAQIQEQNLAAGVAVDAAPSV